MRFTLLLTGLATLQPQAARAVAWVARHGLTPAEYQGEFDTWMGQGLRLRTVSGYLDGNATRFAALWDDEPGPAQSAVHGVVPGTITTMDASAQAAGFRPAWISIYPEGGAIHCATYWEQGGATRVIRPDRTYATFLSDKAQLEAQGYHLLQVSATTLAGVDHYAAVWEKSFVSPLQHWEIRMSADAFQSSFDTWTSKGYRLVSAFGYTVGGTPQFAAVWRKVSTSDWWSYASLSAVNYQTETENAYYQGYRPTFVAGFSVGAQPEFNAIWERNGGWSGGALQVISDGINKYMKSYQTPGVSLAIMKDGRLVYARGFGSADVEAGENAGPLHRFRIASISKPITATAILKLVEKGNTFGLDDKVFGSGKVLGTQYGNGNYSAREKAISVRNLLTHTTGWTSDGPMWDNAYGANHKAIMDWALDQNEPSSQPGSMYQYMNLDYHTLGRIIENYSGQTYESFVKSAVLAPCGITQMELGNQWRAERKQREVAYYDFSGGDPYSEINPHRMDANGGWIATSIDLLQFLRRIDNDPFPSDILSANSRQEMRNYTLSGAGYGLGWFTAGGGEEGHNGCMTGTSSFMIRRSSGVAYAVLANKRTGCSWELKAAVDAIVASLESRGEWPDYDLFPVPSSDYLAWVGPLFKLPTSGGLILDLGLIDKISPYADPDHDGLTNMEEAYHGTDPSKPDRGPFIRAFLDGSEVVFRWGRSTQKTGVTARVLWSQDLVHWASNARIPVDVVAPPRLGSTVETVEVRVPHSAKAGNFMRLQFLTE